jgi:hypothetical protein
MRQSRMTVGPNMPESQDFIPRAGARFLLSRDLRMVVVRETPGVARMAC